MSFFSFLIQYYVWIMIVLVILVVTVIGFLVDSSKGKEDESNKEKVATSNENVDVISNSENVESTMSENLSLSADKTVDNLVTTNSNNNDIFQSQDTQTSADVNNTYQEVVMPSNSNNATSVQAPSTNQVMAMPSGSAVNPSQTVQVPVNQNTVNSGVVAPSSSQSQPVQAPVNANNVNYQSASNGVQAPVSNHQSTNVSNGLGDIFTTNSSQPFDINSMFSKDK